MNRVTIIAATFVALATLTSASFGQEMPEHVKESLDKLVGTWQMQIAKGDTVTTAEVDIEWAVKDTALRFTWDGTDIQTGNQGASTGIIGWHPTKKMVVEYEIGTEGFTSQGTHQISPDGTWISPISGTNMDSEGNIVFYEYHRAIKFKSNDQWTVTGNGMMDGKAVEFPTGTFTRKK